MELWDIIYIIFLEVNVILLAFFVTIVSLCERPIMIPYLLPTGRVPNTKRLNLESVGVELDSTTGAVKVSCYVIV